MTAAMSSNKTLGGRLMKSIIAYPPTLPDRIFRLL
jgi:hypothetical protein